MQYDEHKLVEYFADAPAGVGFSDLDLNNIPHHISCIMDGNGRWATSRGLARTEGHKAGIVSLREIITACVRLGVDVLSDRKSTRLNSSHLARSRMPSSA